MSSLLSADLAAACNALGYFDPKTSKYYADANTLETVKDLIRYLRKDDENYDIRRQLGETKVLQTDLLPLLKNYWEETDLFDVLLRLIVNLTTPALVLWNEEAPVEKISRNHFLQIEDHLQGYKEAFADEAVWAVLSTRLSKLLELDYSERGDENSLIIERILILIRNVLYVPADVMEKRPDNDASIHDQVLWAIHQSGMLDIILYVTSSSVEHMYYFHILEILSFMMREQRPSDLASAALQRSQVEKVRDEAELLAIRHRETRDKQKKAKMFAGARHSRFGGTYVVKSMKSIGENELIYHKPLKKLDELTFDDDKRKLKTPKNRQPIIACTSERRSAFSIRLFLKEFCVEFLNGSYNTMMYHVKDNLVRARGRVQSNDCSYYFWAMRFFMEFNRHYKFEVKLISETMSVQTFHYVQQQSEQFYDLIASDKKRLKLWSKRLHVALLAYRELFLTLAAMDKSTEKSVQDSSKVIKNNIFYILEYREFILALLVNFDETKMSDQYLKDLIETQHIFLKMLENFCGKDGTFIVQQKARKAKNKTKKQIKPNQRVAEELNLDGKWDEVGPQLSCVLETVTEFPTDVVPFDAASDTPIDDQKAEAMRNIQRKLRRGDFEGAVVLLRAAREVWPENDSFGSDNMAPEEEFLALRDVFYADLGENEIARETDQQSADEDTENEEENDEPHSNEGTFKFEDFTKRLPNPKIVRACGIALRQFDNNTVHTNMCIVKLLHRIAFDCKMYVMIFQLSIFRTFQRIFSMKDAPQNKELTKFATYIIRQFIKVSETNKKVFMEALFWKTSQDCHQIETNYAEDLHKSTASERAWSEEQEDELRRLFMEHQQTNNGEDVVDWIVDNLINTNRTRRGVLKKLKEMCLLTAYKGRRKSGSTRPSATWTAVEESLLRKLYEEFKDFDDPLESVMQRLEVPRPKNRIIEKLLVMGLIQDRKEVRKKKSRSRSSRKLYGNTQTH
ncbi:protein timeless homolog isoform X2 [Cylas formicarius]|uniref:protein timeless homolog isoform X2 n=1 Tax=Cylas formicarius TaxID=197179 RepID=UPI0029586789|nr:protein timeless homolog isoform X2 [Cylas formicarius]